MEQSKQMGEPAPETAQQKQAETMAKPARRTPQQGDWETAPSAQMGAQFTDWASI